MCHRISHADTLCYSQAGFGVYGQCRIYKRVTLKTTLIKTENGKYKHNCFTVNTKHCRNCTEMKYKLGD